MSNPTKNSIVFPQAASTTALFLCHHPIAIPSGGFFVPRERLTERFNDWFTKHISTLMDFATAKTKLSLCGRGHDAMLPTGLYSSALEHPSTLQRSSRHDITSNKSKRDGEKTGIL